MAYGTAKDKELITTRQPELQVDVDDAGKATLILSVDDDGDSARRHVSHVTGRSEVLSPSFEIDPNRAIWLNAVPSEAVEVFDEVAAEGTAESAGVEPQSEATRLVQLGPGTDRGEDAAAAHLRSDLEVD